MGSKNEKITQSRVYEFKARRIVSVFQSEKGSRRQRCEPKGRSGHRVTSCETFMYTFGGYNPMFDDDSESEIDIEGQYDLDLDARLFKEIWRFNIVTKEWTLTTGNSKDVFPSELASITLNKIGCYMIIHGGTGIPFGVSSSNVTYAAAFPNCELKILNTTGTLPMPMYGQGSVIDQDNKFLYIVGGTSGLIFSMDVHCLDLKRLEWTKLVPSRSCAVPAGRYRHEICLHDSKIIVFGGGTVESAFDFENLPAFDLKSRSWGTLWTKGYQKSRASQPRFPKPRRCHGGIFVPGEGVSDPEFIICGGFNGSVSFFDVWSLNLRTRQWLLWKSSLPYKIYFHDATLTPQGRALIFGGIIDDDRYELDSGIRTNQVLACWVKIPKLSEIAWEAVVYYTPAVTTMPEAELLDLGIPQTFVSRLC